MQQPPDGPNPSFQDMLALLLKGYQDAKGKLFGPQGTSGGEGAPPVAPPPVVPPGAQGVPGNPGHMPTPNAQALAHANANARFLRPATWQPPGQAGPQRGGIPDPGAMQRKAALQALFPNHPAFR